jgi:phenol 2-monooxygenase
MNQSWGVLDALVTTDFPDIRRKCAIHSANDGNILIIPREGGYLVRIYIELDNVRDGEMLKNRTVTPEKLAEVANRILAPYTIDVKDVGWWAVYEIGQRVTDKFDDVPAAQMHSRLPRVFIAGDACHTHSAKAGQGMNVSMNDTWNLGWKLASVLQGRAKPELLHTYSDERQKIASSSSILTASSPRCSVPTPPKTAQPMMAPRVTVLTRRNSSSTSSPRAVSPPVWRPSTPRR